MPTFPGRLLGGAAALLLAFSFPALAAWPTTPNASLPVSLAPTTGNTQPRTQPGACSDGHGGWFIVWTDVSATPGFVIDIHGQHLDARGAPLWGSAPDGGPDGVLVVGGTGAQQAPRILADGAGGFFLIWSDEALHALRAQRFDASRAELWTAGGLTLGDNFSYQLLPDGQGGILVAYQAGADVSLARITAAGAVLYNGTALGGSPSTGQAGAPRAAADGLGGAFVAFSESLYGQLGQLRVQKVNASGQVQWGTTGVKVASSTSVNGPVFGVVPDGSGGVLLAFVPSEQVETSPLYFQHVLADGSLAFPGDGGAGTQGAILRSQSVATSAVVGVSDADGGAVFGWLDWRNGTPQPFVLRVAADGTPRWQAGGVLVSNDNSRFLTELVRQTPGGYGVIWGRSGAGFGAQSLDADGVARWPANGVAAATNRFASNGSAVWDDQGLMVASDDYTGASSNIWANHLLPGGALGGASDAGVDAGSGGGAGGGAGGGGAAGGGAGGGAAGGGAAGGGAAGGGAAGGGAGGGGTGTGGDSGCGCGGVPGAESVVMAAGLLALALRRRGRDR